MRRLVLIHALVIGFAVQAVAYFAMAAPWGFPPSNVGNSEPNVPFAAAIFIMGIVIVYLGVLLYELLPDRRSA